MKIGILTFHRTSNFGSCLQALALQNAISSLGLDCEIIDYRCVAVEQRESLVEKKHFSSLKDYITYHIIHPIIVKKYRSLLNDLREKTVLSKPYTRETIKESNDEYDAFLVGSDIVWDPQITGGDYTYFLDFVDDDSKKNAFSSSFGDKIDLSQDSEILVLLSKIQNIAVREESAAGFLSEKLKRSIAWVSDPTMLLTKQKWDELLPIRKKTFNKYVLVYFDDDKGKLYNDARKYAEINHYKLIEINYNLRARAGAIISRPTSLSEFLDLIRNAEVVFTASYHGMLFSLYYEKEMIFYTRAHKERMVSLAERLKIMEQCGDEIDILKYRNSIDYGEVSKEIDRFRTESISVLLGELTR